MSELRLKTVFQTQGHTQALKDGTVKLPNAAWEFEEVPSIIQAFRRMVFAQMRIAAENFCCAAR